MKLEPALVVSMKIRRQSPATGVVAEPSPFVSPPYASSLNEVKTTGLAAVPFALMVPFTQRAGSFSETIFTTTPLSSVSVAPGFTVAVKVMR